MDNSEFDQLFAQHAPYVYKYIARRHRGSDVEDLVADVFTLAWQKFEEIPSGYELPWLYRTAWLVLANNHRKRQEIPMELSESQLDSEMFEHDIADLTIQQESMKTLWQSLPEREREILRLVAWEGLTPPEVAEVLGLSVGGASSAISRARKNLEVAFQAINNENLSLS